MSMRALMAIKNQRLSTWKQPLFKVAGNPSTTTVGELKVALQKFKSTYLRFAWSIGNTS